MNIILLLFIAAAAIQITFDLVVFGRLAWHRKTNQIPEQWQPVSVIICARNEAENLKKNLLSILKQDYSSFELIVVDDESDDETEIILKSFQNQFSNLRVIHLNQEEKIFPGKKGALTEGIKHAAHDFILLTDADCFPQSDQWIKKMTTPLHFNLEIVIGYSPYEKQNSFLNWMIRWDTLFIAIQYFSFALMGKPYMAVGRNLAYRKKIFNTDIFSNTKILSGDDDLLIQHAATFANTAIEISPESFMFSKPKETFAEWYKQKARHLQAGLHYKWMDKILLSLIPLTRFLFYSTLIILLWNKTEVVSVLALFIGRILIQSVVYHRILKRVAEKSLWKTWLFYDTAYVLLYLIFITSILWRTVTPPSWK